LILPNCSPLWYGIPSVVGRGQILSTVDKNALSLGVIPLSDASQSRTISPSEPKNGSLDCGSILVSACLAGRRCRFDGSSNQDDLVTRLVAEGRAVLVCPEVDGGLGTPRPSAEIVGGDGGDVLAGRALVVTRDGTDVTDAYIAGAKAALKAAQASGARTAVLKARSPSCGSGMIYDGSFTRETRAGDGVTAALLAANGIKVLTEEDSLEE
jgi:uncharacterized protein YbbK (DUF523 family)